MANTKLISELILEAREVAGVEGLDDRFPDTQLIRWFNTIWRLLRVRLANLGIQGLTVPTAQLTLPTAAPIATERFLEIPLPDGAVGVYGIDVLVNQQWEPLIPGSFAQRRDYQFANATFPTHWLTESLPAENGASLTAGKLMLFPLATGALPYRVWFLPAWVDILNAASLIYGHDTWHEWAVQGLVRRISQKDNDANDTMQEAVRQQLEVWTVIKSGAANMNLAQPIQRVRSRRRRR